MSRYEVEVHEADSEGSRKSCLTASDLSCATLVHIFFENLEITTFTYTPRLEPIGILSFIGGYVGLWLGISLLTVYDFLETRFFRIIATARRKWKARKGKTRVSALPDGTSKKSKFNDWQGSSTTTKSKSLPTIYDRTVLHSQQNG